MTINKLCWFYRMFVMKKTLKEICEGTSVKISTLSAFEQNRSTNLNLILSYTNKMTKEEKINFSTELMNLL